MLISEVHYVPIFNYLAYMADLIELNLEFCLSLTMTEIGQPRRAGIPNAKHINATTYLASKFNSTYPSLIYILDLGSTL